MTAPITHKHPSGFTLIELMAVVSLVGIVVAAGSVMIAQASQARQRTDRAIAGSAQADAALRTVVAALRNTLRPIGDEEGAWFFTGTDGTLDGRPADTLRFFTVDHRPVRADQPESDVREVAFTLEPGGERGLPYLRRRLDPTFTLPPDQGGVTDRVAENVIAFDAEYFDGRRWVIDWPESLAAVPVAVRITVAVADPQSPGHVISQRRTVHLPHLPALRQPLGNASNQGEPDASSADDSQGGEP